MAIDDFDKQTQQIYWPDRIFPAFFNAIIEPLGGGGVWVNPVH